MTAATTRDALLPCPFDAAHGVGLGHGGRWFGVGCDEQHCSAYRRAFTHLSEAEAIAAWNRRAIPAAATGADEAVWLPIEVAPHGIEILLWRDDCGQFIGSYTSADAFPLTQTELDALSEDDLCLQNWFTQWPHAQRLEGLEEPTHWMPLPSAPGATHPASVRADALELIADNAEAVAGSTNDPEHLREALRTTARTIREVGRG